MTDKQYEEWFQNLSTDEKLKELGLEDTPENRGWIECPEDKQMEYIKKHPKWWKNF